MAKSYNQKLKLLYLLQMFSHETDEMHSLSRKELENRLAKHDIRVERKSLYHDIETLRAFGMDIIYRKEKPEGYYLASHEFELPELKLLVDAVQSSKFITEKKSSSLIKKLEGLTSKYEAKKLQRQVFVANRVKTMNESIYYNVDKIHTAIASNQQIMFQYSEWTVQKEMKLRHEGKMYRMSPWVLSWQDEKYYLIAYDQSASLLKHFRVDKMINIQVTDEIRVGKEEFMQFDLADYTQKTFGMYAGEEKMVRIRFANHLAGVVIDRFGKDVSLREDGKEHFIARIKVAVSIQFFGWLTGLGAEASILTPSDVVEQYKELLSKILLVQKEQREGENYGNDNE